MARRSPDPTARLRASAWSSGRPVPGTVLPILAAAYGLTGREQEVISSVFAGHSTKEISARLHISTYTVQDHLKSIFGKVGVTSRGELAHHLALQFT